MFTQKQHISLKLSNKRPVSKSCIGGLLARLKIASDCLIRFKNTNSRTVALSIYWLLLSERLAEYQSSQHSVVSQEILGWKDFGAFWLVCLKKCWKFNTGLGDTKTISVLVMFPTSTFLKRRELRQIRRICGKWKSDKCDTSWEHLDLSKKGHLLPQGSDEFSYKWVCRICIMDYSIHILREQLVNCLV